MPLITHFERAETKQGALQPTQVVATYKVIEGEGDRKILQIDTRGSAAREHPGKLSQTFQLNEHSAAMLWQLLGKEFGFSS